MVISKYRCSLLTVLGYLLSYIIVVARKNSNIMSLIYCVFLSHIACFFRIFNFAVRCYVYLHICSIIFTLWTHICEYLDSEAQ